MGSDPSPTYVNLQPHSSAIGAKLEAFLLVTVHFLAGRNLLAITAFAENRKNGLSIKNRLFGLIILHKHTHRQSIDRILLRSLFIVLFHGHKAKKKTLILKLHFK